MSNARFVALEAIIDILEREAYAEEALSKAFSLRPLSKKDKAFATELIYGITRNKSTIDYLISKVSKKDIKNLSYNLRNILRLGVYQLENMRVPEYAAVNSSVELAKQVENTRIASYVNGVLRNLVNNRPDIQFPKITKNPAHALSIRYSHPKWLVRRWLDRFGLDNTINLLSFNNTPAQITIHHNPIKANKEEVIEELNTEHIKPVQSSISPDCLKIGNVGIVTQIPGFYEGHWYIQDESSSLVVDVLNPQPEEHVLDLCAAPGIKTVQIAGKMNNQGKITAVEVNPDRLSKIQENCYRLGVTIVNLLNTDGTNIELGQNELADRILIDAPCSNTGVFAKRADARWHKKKNDFRKLTTTQLNLINNAVNSLKPGGIIVYSVCSIEPEEGIDIIESFLTTHKDFKLIDINERLPENLKGTFETKFAMFLPFKHLTDGFFIACLKHNG
jgi:16S rRNA (cytosine967-C5)-methyltransferase